MNDDTISKDLSKGQSTENAELLHALFDRFADKSLDASSFTPSSRDRSQDSQRPLTGIEKFMTIFDRADQREIESNPALQRALFAGATPKDLNMNSSQNVRWMKRSTQSRPLPIPKNAELVKIQSSDAVQTTDWISQRPAKSPPEPSTPASTQTETQLDSSHSEHGADRMAQNLEETDDLVDKVLASLGRSHLGIDILGSDPAARFMRSLMEKIKALQLEIEWLKEEAFLQDRYPFPQSPSGEDRLKGSPVETLYGIHCEGRTSIFHDIPFLVGRQAVMHARGDRVFTPPTDINSSVFAGTHAILLYVRECPHVRAGPHRDIWKDGPSFAANAELHVFLTSPEFREWLSRETLFSLRTASLDLLGLDSRAGAGVRSISQPPSDPFYFHHRQQLLELRHQEGGPSEGQSFEADLLSTSWQITKPL